MIKIHPNIIVGSINELAQVLNTVHYIINCSVNLNNYMVHPNYLNTNIQKFSLETLPTLNSIYDFVYQQVSLGKNIFLCCETGTNQSLIIGMFIIMKMFNINFYNVFYKIFYTNKINSYEYYSGLVNYEPYILSNTNTNDKMDTS
jgi:hypothetical protein